MKTIIIATDFSAEAKNATQYILPVAKSRNYRIVLFSLKNASIHALNARMPSYTIDNFLDDESHKLAKAAKEIQQENELEVIPYFTTGLFYEELERCIEEYDAFMLVMGMAGKSVEQDLLGNTTTTAINRLKIPILAIPRNAKFKGLKNILYACDVERGMQKKVLKDVQLIANDIGAQVEVFYVKRQLDKLINDKVPDLKNLMKELAPLNLSYKDVISTEIVESIKEEVEALQADLLIMVPYRYGFWNSLVHKSKTRMMAYGSNVPLLSIPLG